MKPWWGRRFGAGFFGGRGGGGAAPPIGPARAVTPIGAPSPLAPGGCRMPLSALSESYQYLVIGRADPYATRWVPVLDLIEATPGVLTAAGEIFPLGRTTPIPGSGSAIHPGDGGARTVDNQHWHHISIGVTGEAIFPVNAEPPNIDRVAQSQGNQSTLLKAEITLSMGNSRTRRFRIDVGAGVEIDVKCRAVVSVIGLVPDPTSLPASRPTPLLDGEFNFAVALVTTVTTCEAPKVHRVCAKYTQSFFIDPTADPTQAFGLMPIVADAQEIELYTDDVIVAAGSVAGQFLYVLSNPIVASYTSVEPASAARLGLLQSLPAQAHVPASVIPGNANAISLSRGAVDDNSTITVVQILNV